MPGDNDVSVEQLEAKIQLFRSQWETAHQEALADDRRVDEEEQALLDRIAGRLNDAEARVLQLRAEQEAAAGQGNGAEAEGIDPETGVPEYLLRDDGDEDGSGVTPPVADDPDVPNTIERTGFFDNSAFYDAYVGSIRGWCRDCRIAINGCAIDAIEQPPSGGVGPGDFFAAISLVIKSDTRAAAVLEAVDKIVSIAQNIYSSITPPSPNIGQIRSSMAQSFENLQSSDLHQSYARFVRAHCAQNNIDPETGAGTNADAFASVCRNFADNHLATFQSIARRFLMVCVEATQDDTFNPLDWGDGGAAGFVQATCNYNGTRFTTPTGYIDDISESMTNAIGNRFGSTAVVDMPLELRFKVEVINLVDHVPEVEGLPIPSHVTNPPAVHIVRTTRRAGATDFRIASSEVDNGQEVFNLFMEQRIFTRLTANQLRTE